MTQANSIIKVDQVSLIYEKNTPAQTIAIDNVSLDVFPHEYAVFLGPSGCGKSSLLYLIAGFEYPTKGKIWVNGKEISHLSRNEVVAFHRNTIGMIFQQYYPISSLSVLDNVVLPAMFEGVPAKVRTRRALELLQRFEILEHAKKLPSQLSGGQQQRVAICRALMNNPEIILADEPIGNLDSHSSDQVMGLLRELNERDKKTVILVTHDPRYLHHGHKIFQMKDGKVIQTLQEPGKESPESPSKSLSELERLARMFPMASKSRIKAKAIVNSFITHYDIEEIEHMEEAIELFLVGKISAEKLQEFLSLGRREGGAALYKETSLHLATYVQSIGARADVLRTIFQESSAEKRAALLHGQAAMVLEYLMTNYHGSIHQEIQKTRLKEGIVKRLQGEFHSKTFEMFLDAPISDGGVGLNQRTAKNFTREIEVLLAYLESNE